MSSPRLPASALAAIGIVGLLIVVPCRARAQESRSLSLEDCLRIARESNPLLRGARYGVEAQQESLLQTRSARYPQLSLTAGVERQQTDDATNHTLSNTDAYTPLGVSASMLLFDFGRIRRQSDIARKDLESAGHISELQEEVVVQRIKKDYFDALRAVNALTITEASIRTRRKFLSIIGRAYERGSRSRFDLARAQTDYEAALLDRIAAVSAVRVAQKRLLTDMGTPDARWSPLSGPLESDVLRFNEEIATQTALHSRPEVRLARAKVEAEQFRTKLAWNQHLPKLSMTSAYSLNRQMSPSTLHTNTWQAGVAASVELFGGFGTQAGYGAAAARAAAAREEYDAARQAVTFDVSAALITLRAEADGIRIARRLLESAEESLELAVNQFDRGRGSIFDLTDAQNQALRARLRLNDSLADYRIAEATLERAVGLSLQDLPRSVQGSDVPKP